MEETEPKCSIILSLENDRVIARTELPAGANLKNLAYMLTMLHKGGYQDLINGSVASASWGTTHEDFVNRSLSYVEKKLSEERGDGPGCPVVSPLHTFKHLANKSLR